MNQWWNKSQSSVIQKLRSWRWTITEGFRNHGIYRVLFVGTETGFHHRFGSHSSIFGRQVLEEGKTIGRWTKILLLMCFWGEEDLIRCIPKVLWPCNQNNIRNISTSSQIENFFVSLKVFHRKSLHLKVELRSVRELDRLLHGVQGGWIVSRVTRQQKLQLDLLTVQKLLVQQRLLKKKKLSETVSSSKKTAKDFRKLEMNFVVNLAQHFKSHQSSSSRPLLAPQNPAWCACSRDAGKLPRPKLPDQLANAWKSYLTVAF